MQFFLDILFLMNPKKSNLPHIQYICTMYIYMVYSKPTIMILIVFEPIIRKYEFEREEHRKREKNNKTQKHG